MLLLSKIITNVINFIIAYDYYSLLVTRILVYNEIIIHVTFEKKNKLTHVTMVQINKDIVQ